jgi:hypothetical protein
MAADRGAANIAREWAKYVSGVTDRGGGSDDRAYGGAARCCDGTELVVVGGLRSAVLS